MEIKNIKADNFEVEGRTIIGYAAAFGNKDRVGDIIEPGAFKKTLRERSPKVFYNHTYPIGTPIKMREDSTGLYTESRLSKTARADEILELVKDGVIGEMSIAYEVVKEDYDNAKKVRTLRELKLYEYGPVDFAANESAVITGVKQLTERIKNADTITDETISEIRMLIKSLDAIAARQPEESTAAEEPEQSTLDVKWIDVASEEFGKINELIRSI